MTYTQQGDDVTLQMKRDDFERLMMMLGYALGSVMKQNDGKGQFYRWLELTNELNNGNPNFAPYEIPPEFASKPG